MNRVAVVGAGVMGAGIAAQVANAGTPVRLLDRAGIAAAALQRMRAAGPGPSSGPFMSEAAAALVEPGDSDTELHRLVDCDWIIEAVVERLDVKQDLYRRIDAVRRPDAAVSSNTSTIRLDSLLAGLPEGFARHFLITHFFNPPRQMRLLELVAGPASDPAVLQAVRRFCDVALGKTPVDCHDRPGFIANRIGTYWLQLGVNAARDLNLSVEAADAAMGRPAGIPKTGVFGLLDLIGLDLMPQIVGSLQAALPPDDRFQATIRDWPLLTGLLAEGYTGRKGKGGFYRLDRSGGGRVKLALDLQTGAWRPEEPAEPPAGDLPGLFAAAGPVGAYARTVLGGTLDYAASLVPEVADDIASVDAAMRLGFAWKQGPFEMLDSLGRGAPGWQAPFYDRAGRQRGRDGGMRPVPRAAGVLRLRDVQAAGPLLRSESAALWDLGDGVACVELTGKLGSLDAATLRLLRQATDLVAARFAALVIGHDGENFSAGANLSALLFAANIAAWDAIEALLQDGQAAFKALKYAPFPVVAAVSGLTLGGGCEIALHADAIQAHAETQIGLVECGVGLVPGWGGCGEMLARCGAAEPVFALVAAARRSGSAAEARAMRYLRPDDGITMNRDRLLADAKARALSMRDGYRPPAPPEFRRPDDGGCLTLPPGTGSEYDRTVAGALAAVLGGGAAEASEADLLAREREQFLRLIRDERTLARIAHTLSTGTKLRN